MSVNFTAHLECQMTELWAAACRMQPALGARPEGLVPLWVGLSGGVDSVVLLHELVRIKSRLPFNADIRAIHINHQISPNASQWQGFCQALCVELGVPFKSQTVDVISTGKGIEDAAREARFAVFNSIMTEPGLLALGHHGDDQVETLILRLGRGTGSRGLMGIPPARSIKEGVIVRPMLALGRSAIEQHAAMNGWSHVVDESNMDCVYDRNYVRQSVSPLLAKRWPEYVKTWTQAMSAAREAEELLIELAADDIRQLAPTKDMAGDSINFVALGRLSLSRQRNVIRHWLRQQGDFTITRQHLDDLLVQLADRSAEAHPQFRLDKEWCLRVYGQRLYLTKTNGCWRIKLSPALADGKALVVKGVPEDYRILTRTGGERCHPAGRSRSQTLKKILQEQDCPPWLRENIPLVYCGDAIAAVGSLFVCQGFDVAIGEFGIAIEAVFE